MSRSSLILAPKPETGIARAYRLIEQSTVDRSVVETTPARAYHLIEQSSIESTLYRTPLYMLDLLDERQGDEGLIKSGIRGTAGLAAGAIRGTAGLAAGALKGTGGLAAKGVGALGRTALKGLGHVAGGIAGGIADIGRGLVGAKKGQGTAMHQLGGLARANPKTALGLAAGGAALAGAPVAAAGALGALGVKAGYDKYKDWRASRAGRATKKVVDVGDKPGFGGKLKQWAAQKTAEYVPGAEGLMRSRLAGKARSSRATSGAMLDRMKQAGLGGGAPGQPGTTAGGAADYKAAHAAAITQERQAAFDAHQKREGAKPPPSYGEIATQQRADYSKWTADTAATGRPSLKRGDVEAEKQARHQAAAERSAQSPRGQKKAGHKEIVAREMKRRAQAGAADPFAVTPSTPRPLPGAKPPPAPPPMKGAAPAGGAPPPPPPPPPAPAPAAQQSPYAKPPTPAPTTAPKPPTATPTPKPTTAAPKPATAPTPTPASPPTAQKPTTASERPTRLPGPPTGPPGTEKKKKPGFQLPTTSGRSGSGRMPGITVHSSTDLQRDRRFRLTRPKLLTV